MGFTSLALQPEKKGVEPGVGSPSPFAFGAILGTENKMELGISFSYATGTPPPHSTQAPIGTTGLKSALAIPSI